MTEEIKRRLYVLIEARSGAGIFFPFAELCVLCDNPIELHRDERARLHNVSGAAVLYADGWGVYSVHGVCVPSWIIEHKEQISVRHIADERNAEVRRVMLDMFGAERYLTESGAKEIGCDERGVLYRTDLPDDEPLVMVKVRNSTAEPDGTFKDYFLRVPPTMQTASQAVAWTFGMESQDYRPIAES